MRDDRVITLLTDFGLSDAYVGIMKGVILGIAPRSRLVDLTHEVPPQAVEVGALHLGDAMPWFPPGTVHLAVVDPGVGTSRRAIVVETGAALGVGPDNGLLEPLLAHAVRVVEIADESLFLAQVSATFHGRDIFAPVAAHLATGRTAASLGPEISDPVRLDIAPPRREGETLVGKVIHVDRFGNLITSIAAGDVAGWGVIELRVAGRTATGPHRAYAEDAPGPGGAAGLAVGAGGAGLRVVVGSSGRLEIALPGGSAAEAAGAFRGERVTARPAAHG